jgi:hypothetical protein
VLLDMNLDKVDAETSVITTTTCYHIPKGIPHDSAVKRLETEWYQQIVRVLR